MKAFLPSQFKYCPLIWMSYDRRVNNRINRIHEKALRIIYNDTSSNFPELLQKDNSVNPSVALTTINATNIQEKFRPKPLLYEKNLCAEKNLIYFTNE